jgi:hypothetical protein
MEVGDTEIWRRRVLKMLDEHRTGKKDDENPDDDDQATPVG